LRITDIPPEARDEARQMYTFKRVAQGDVRVNVRSPFDIYVDPLAGEDGMQSVRWLIEEAVRAPEDVQERYGLSKRPDADAQASPGLVEARAPGWLRSTAGEKVGVRVYELWQRPCAKWPEGRHVVWCKDRLLANDPNPTKGGGLPYVMFVGVPVPGRFWPSSMTSDLRPLNAELNKTRSQMRDNANRIGNPALLVPNDQQNFQWTGMPGEQVSVDMYSGGNLPQFLTPPNLPRGVADEVGLIENSIREVSHQFEVSKGQVPAGVTAASAIQLLQEADQTIIAMDAQDFEFAVSEAGRLVLDYAARFYKQERLLQIGGEDEDWDFQEFRAGQLKRDVPTVQVKPGSMIPRSTAARQALMEHILTLLLQNGHPIRPEAMGKFFRQFEVGGLESLISGFAVDQTQIAAENALLRQGQAEMPPVNDWDNHVAHIAGHEEAMKSRHFRLAPDAVKDRFRAHWESHKAEMLKLATEQAKEQAAVQLAAQPALPEPAPQDGGGAPAQLPSGPSGPSGLPSPPPAPPSPSVA
jgi:hypothetical protein